MVAEKLRRAVEAYHLEWGGQAHQVGASIGLVAVNGAHATAAEVLASADAACYQAKRQGRNQVALEVSAGRPWPDASSQSNA